MFKREVSNSVEENFIPVDMTSAQIKTAVEASAPAIAGDATVSAERAELFVLAANIYYRARKNTRARAGGIF